VRVLASVMGVEGLSNSDRRFLAFGELFEQRLVAQPAARTLEESMATGWEALRTLPHEELTRLSRPQIDRHLGGSHG
jgi:V/A-type H+-transporting ATPase subunit B